MNYSYHSFLLPFIWECGNDRFLSVFTAGSDDNIWQNDDALVQDNSMRTAEKKALDKDASEFDSFQYFNYLSRNLIFPDKTSGLVHNFSFKRKYLKGLEYVIHISDKKYSLSIENVFLKIFSSGIAVMSINCVNSGYTDKESVKAINEYGRRLALPYWNGRGKSSGCADALEITGENISIKDDFNTFDGDVSLTYISKVVRGLLDRNGKGIRFRAKYTKDKNEIQIKPVMDEKMYVACLVCDKELVKNYQKDHLSRKGFSRRVAADLAEFVKVDAEGNCQSEDNYKLNKYLSERLYTDKLSEETPSLLAVSERSYIKFTSEEESEVKYFYSVYCRIIIAVLVQCASIVNFQQQIISITNDIDKKGKKITNKEINKVMALQERYVSFQNCYIFKEITFKREGKFLYGKLLDIFEISSENEMFNYRLGRLYELVSTAQGYTFNKWGLIISLIATEFSIFMFTKSFSANSISDLVRDIYSETEIIALFLAIAAVIIFTVSKLIFKRKK